MKVRVIHVKMTKQTTTSTCSQDRHKLSFTSFCMLSQAAGAPAGFIRATSESCTYQARAAQPEVIRIISSNNPQLP